MNKSIPKMYILFLIITTLFSCEKENETAGSLPKDKETTANYYPPVNNANWETISAESLAWNINEIDNLKTFLENSNTKSFMILYKGKIAMEVYFNEQDANKNWYWASAGKTLTTAVVGIAQEEGFLSINNKVSDYLGLGCTDLSVEKENLITIKNLLPMASGLDDSMGNAISPESLFYKTDTGRRWAYHNVYVKLQDVVANATGKSWKSYFEEKLKRKIGMNGTYINNNNIFNVYWSTTRSMARFGLLTATIGVWKNTQIIPKIYTDEATNTSQNINLAYGYLWQLNGKTSYLLPNSQFTFQENLVPNAPEDMYCALGKK